MSAPPSSRPRARDRARAAMPRDVWILTVNAFFVSVGFGVMMPVLPAFAKQFGVSNLMIGLVVSSFAFMRMITAPWCGKIIDAVGVRIALGVGVFTVAASSAAAGFATTFAQLLVFRALGGIGSALFTVSSMTMLIRAVDDSRRGQASGFYQGGFLLGGMAGPALGGIVSLISVSAPFFFYAITLVIGGTLCLVFIKTPRQSRSSRSTKPKGRPLSDVISDTRYQSALLMNFAVGWQSFGVRSALIPLYVTGTLAMGRQWTGYALAVAAVAQSIALIPFGRLTDTWGRRPVMVMGGIVCGLSAIAMPLSGRMSVLTLVLCIYAVGSAMVSTAPTASVGDAVGPRGGTPIAIFSMSSDVGSILGPLVAGWLSDRYGMPAAFSIGSVLLVLAGLHSLRMPRHFVPAHAKTGQEVAAADDQAKKST